MASAALIKAVHSTLPLDVTTRLTTRTIFLRCARSFAIGLLPAPMSPGCWLNPRISFTQIRLTTLSSQLTAQVVSVGRIKCARRNGWRRIAGRWYFQTRRQTELLSCIGSWALHFAFLTRRAALVALAIGERRERFWPPGIFEDWVWRSLDCGRLTPP